MSGHSKFANIKRKKEKNDAIKGKIFTRIGREIAVAVKEGGPCPNTNSKLKDIISKAKYNNMPNETIERNIKKASGNINSINYEYITYEGYGPCGVAIIVDVLTDNKNRAIANIRSTFTKYGGNIGTSGCVSFLFDKNGVILIEKNDNILEDNIMTISIESGALDFNLKENYYEIITEVKDFSYIKNLIEEKNITISSAEICMLPKTFVSVEDNSEDMKKIDKLLSILNEEDDVQNIWHNMIVK